MSLAFISNPACAGHNMGNAHPESPLRLAAINNAVDESELADKISRVEATPIDVKLLELAHDKAYINFIFTNTPNVGTFVLDADTCMNSASLNAALLSAGAAVNAVDLVMQNKVDSAFCATRPPGHHAERNRAMGFCFFNNVAIAAIYAKQKYQLSRIAILDFDVHHGNGTQEILMDKEGFLFCSTFQHPLYPNSGTENHPQHIINSPLPENSDGQTFQNVIRRDWLPALHDFKPELIFISAGFDAHKEDQISQINLVESDYQWVTEQIKTIADKYAQNRIISVLEGGYSLAALGRSVVVHIKTLLE